MAYYTSGFLAAFILSIILTLIVKRIAIKFDITDKPTSERKIQKKPVPLLGGVAIFLSFSLVLLFFVYLTDLILGDWLQIKYLAGIVIAGLFIIIGGILDDKFNIKPIYQLIFPALAIFTIILSGIGISHVRNPFGGIIVFGNISIIFTIIWLLGMMYTTKLMDGLDGLVTGVGVIGAIIIFIISLIKIPFQADTALMALIFAGACAGFLIFNFNPAKIFLGESGSLFIGFMLGILAIISGSKVATALLIMGIPILDVIWVILRRLFWEHKNPFRTSDRKHLHFRLLDIGLSQRQAVIFMYFLTALFGSLSIVLQTEGKLVSLILMVVVMVVLGCYLVFKYKKRLTQGV